MKIEKRVFVKSILIIVFSSILIQWFRSFQKICQTNRFLIYRYHDDIKINKYNSIVKKMFINDILTRNHRIFNEKKNNARIIVIITYYILTKRHDSSTLKNYRRKKFHWSKQKTNRKFDDLNFNWKRNLSKLWEKIICDETQFLKNFDFNIITTMFWFFVFIIIFVTITFISKKIKNWVNYMFFCESRKTNKWWSNFFLRKLSFNENDDSYAFFENHFVEKLQITMNAYLNWVKNIFNAIDQKFRLNKIWKKNHITSNSWKSHFFLTTNFLWKTICRSFKMSS